MGLENSDILKSKSLKSLKLFIKGSLVLIGLFAVLYCGVAVLILNSGDKLEISKNIKNDNDEDHENGKKIVIDKKIIIGKNIENNLCVSILVLTIPLIVFFIFSCFMKSHYKSLGIKCNGTLLKMHKKEAIVEACLMVAKALRDASGENGGVLQNLLEKMLLIFLNIGSEEKGNNSEYKVLCDDCNKIIVFMNSK